MAQAHTGICTPGPLLCDQPHSSAALQSLEVKAPPEVLMKLALGGDTGIGRVQGSSLPCALSLARTLCEEAPVTASVWLVNRKAPLAPSKLRPGLPHPGRFLLTPSKESLVPQTANIWMITQETFNRV